MDYRTADFGFPLWGSLLLVAVLLVLVAYILLYLPIVILGALALGFWEPLCWEL